MIDSIELENFKAFGKRARVKLAPITLFFGENSAGKSSLLQSLTLLEQSCRLSNKHDPLLVFQSEDGSHDLGSFSEVIFNHDVKRDLKIRVDLSEHDTLGRQCSELKDHPVGMEFVFSRESAANDLVLKTLSFFSQKDNIGKIATLTPTGEQLSCSWLTDSEIYWQPAYEAANEKIQSLKSELNEREKILKTSQHYVDEQFKLLEQAYRGNTAGPRLHEPVEELKEMRSRLRHDEEMLKNDIRLFDEYIKGCTSGLADFIRYQKSLLIASDSPREINWALRKRGFLPNRSRFNQPTNIAPESVRLLDNAERHGFRHRNEMQQTSLEGYELSTQILDATRSFIDNLRRLDPLGPFRQTPKRVYQFQGTIPPDVGYEGEYVPQLLFRDSALLDRANKWMKRLNIDYTLKPENIGKKDRDLFEIRLVDSKSQNSDVSHAISDVGFGISQLLPFIVKCLLGKNKIISIEQPEVHVHPRLQADLGDLLVDSIGDPTNHQFLIETHSEHLMLRLQRLIRDGKLNPSDLSVIYVSRGKEGSEITYLPLNERGNFIEEWPNGFFPERMKEIL